jgi:hypothetical protein
MRAVGDRCCSRIPHREENPRGGMVDHEERGFGPSGDPEDPGEPPWFLCESEPEPPWQDLFLSDSASVILNRLCAQDALQLAEMCEHRLAEVAFLIHPDRLLPRAIARVARSAAYGYDGTPPLFEWLMDRIDRSIDDLLTDDIEAERLGIPPSEEELEDYLPLIPEETGIAPELSRLACVVFNTLPEAMRCPFFAVFIEGMSIEEYAMVFDVPLDDIVSSIEKTTYRLVLLVENGEPGPEDDE